LPTTTENNYGIIESATYDTYQATPASTRMALGNTELPTTTQTVLGNTSFPGNIAVLPTSNQGPPKTIGLPSNTQLSYTTSVNLPQTTIGTITNQPRKIGLTTLSQPITTQIKMLLKHL